MFKVTPIFVAGLLLVFPTFASALEVYRVKSENCTGGRSTSFQSGFSTSVGSEIVTALHGVSGCRKITASRYDGQIVVDTIEELQVKHADLERDIAVLTKPGLQVVSFPNSMHPSATDTVRITGFPQASAAPDTILVSVGDPAVRPLRSILRAKDVLRYQSVGSPSPSVNIIKLDGNAQVGHSGSPVVDQFGEVLGVVIGGFGLGEFGTSWAIPLSEINTVPVSDNALQELSRLRGQFSDSIAAPIKIARLHLLCGSEGDDVKSPFDLSTSEATQVRDFRDTLEENKDGLIYAEVTLEQNSCMACDCARELENWDDEFDISDDAPGYATFVGSLGIAPNDAPLMPTIWREGYRINSFVFDDSFGVTTTFALPLPRHLEKGHYKYAANRMTRLWFSGLFISREHFQTGWQMLHLEPTEIDEKLQPRLKCIRDHLQLGEEADDVSGIC